MNIQETTAELRRIAIELRDDTISIYRRVRLEDRAWDLRARYEMLMRQAGYDLP